VRNTALNTFISPLVRVGMLAAFLIATHSAADAATLTINVSRPGVGNKGSQPLSNAQVCVSSGSGTLSSNTNSQGVATFSNAPQGQLTVTASASGFVGQQIQFTMGTIDKTESFLLQAGSGGPVCTVKPPPPPVTVKSLTLNPTAVNGPLSANGTVTLSSPAPPGGFTVNLSSSNTSIATVPSSVLVPENSSSQTFIVSSRIVTAVTQVTITASGGGTSKTAVLTVEPQGPPPVASLRVLVGTTTRVISGAAVCVTPVSGSPRSALTDLGGNAVFDGVAQGPVTITVSSSGFTGQSHASTLGPDGGTARFIMTEGSGGPVCAAAAPPATPATLSISSFDWRVNRRTPLFFEVALAFAASRNPGGAVLPTHYRVGESSDLSAQNWIPFQGGVPLFQLGYRGTSLTAFGQRTLFLQLRQGDLISDVASKAVNLQSQLTSEFRLTGTDLFEMLSLAKQNGFPLRTRTVSVTQSVCGAMDFDLNTLKFEITASGLPDREWVKVVEANLLELSTKRFTPGWRVTNIDIEPSPDFPSSTRQSFSGVADGDGFRTTITLTQRARREADPNFCLQGNARLRAIVLEGPGDDMALDQAKRWKNMFPH